MAFRPLIQRTFGIFDEEVRPQLLPTSKGGGGSGLQASRPELFRATRKVLVLLHDRVIRSPTISKSKHLSQDRLGSVVGKNIERIASVNTVGQTRETGVCLDWVMS